MNRVSLGRRIHSGDRPWGAGRVHGKHDEVMPVIGTVSGRRDKVVSTREKGHSDDATLGIEGPLSERFWVVRPPVRVERISARHETFGLETRYLGEWTFGTERSGREGDGGEAEETLPDGSVMSELIVKPADL